MRRLTKTSFVAAAALLLCSSLARGHEIGTTRVSILLRADRGYEIEVVTDATALFEKLEASAGRPVDPATFNEVFLRRVMVAFDGTSVRPSTEYSVSRPADAVSPPLVTVRLAGNVPRDARRFTWAYSWTFTSYPLAIRAGRSEAVVTEWLHGGDTSTPFLLAGATAAPGRIASAWRYFSLGFTHIIPSGLDHVLFVLGLFLLNGRSRSLLWQVSAFTIAHSITLGLSLYEVVGVSPAVVEPLIALSIAYVAIENLFLSELRSWRVALIFAFGLLHGLGFAGALKEVGLQRSDFLEALLFFNVGVEAGQCAVIAAAFAVIGLHCGSAWYRRRVVVPVSLLIACMAMFWTAQRVPF